jgi:FkbM family methyltransferase
MSWRTKIEGLKELWQFDNRWYLIYSRLIVPSRTELIYKYQGLEFLTDHAAGDANGARELLVSDMYRGLLRKLDLPKRIVVLDIGANNGGFPLLLSAEGFEIEQLVCVELNPRTCERLSLNLSRNYTDNYSIENAALCASRRTIQFHAGNSGTSDNIYSDPLSESESVEIAGITFDDSVEKFDGRAIDLCKIDIVGAEFELIDSSSIEKLRKCRLLMIEIHHEPSRPRKRLIEWLAKLDFVEVDPQPNDKFHHVHLFQNKRS